VNYLSLNCWNTSPADGGCCCGVQDEIDKEIL
jgi:hypothetical protein